MARGNQPHARDAGVIEDARYVVRRLLEIVDQAAVDRIDAERVVLARIAQIAVDQQRGFRLVERKRGGQVAGDEAAAGAGIDRDDKRDEVLVAAESEQARADLAERI